MKQVLIFMKIPSNSWNRLCGIHSRIHYQKDSELIFCMFSRIRTCLYERLVFFSSTIPTQRNISLQISASVQLRRSRSNDPITSEEKEEVWGAKPRLGGQSLGGQSLGGQSLSPNRRVAVGRCAGSTSTDGRSHFCTAPYSNVRNLWDSSRHTFNK